MQITMLHYEPTLRPQTNLRENEEDLLVRIQDGEALLAKRLPDR